MLSINAGSFYSAVANIEMLRGYAGAQEGGTLVADPAGITKRVLQLQASLADLPTPITSAAIDDLVELMGHKRITADRLREELSGISATLRRELSSAHLLTLKPDRGQYLEQTTPLFGAEVDTRFPSASYDLAEAGKCYALDRPTACVFHLMRVLEFGIEGTRKCLGIPDPVKAAERNWGTALRKINEAIAAKSSWQAPEDTGFFAEIHASLDAVRNVWRNATMHVEKKYTAEEAEHIFAAVRGFMTKLASRCDENGQPLA